MMIGERIKDHRKRLGFSQEKIAELVGTSRQAVTKWENGQSVPCMENLMVLANIFGITLSELTGNTDDQTTNESIAEVIAPAPTKKLLTTDVTFVFIVIFAAWSLFQIPALIGYSISGFIIIFLQAAAIFYVPLYLFWLRPRQKKSIADNKKKPHTKGSIVEKILWALGSMAVLGGFYVLSRHDVFGQWHNMNQWPFILFVVGLTVIFIASFSSSRIVMGCAAIGYIAGFILAMFFNRDYPGPGDTLDAMSYNNAWIIWTYVYLGIIAAGIIVEILFRRIKVRKV